MRQVMHTSPHEHIAYFGDTARVPYGGKSSETIMRYSIENAIFLMEKNVKILVIACNTSAAFAVDKLQQIFNIPVIGVIAPGAEKAVEVTRTGRIGILGTKGTVRSGAYQREIHKRMPQATVVPIACPLLVPLVEERFYDHPAAKMIIKEYLQPLRASNVDTLLLGCTHYPLLYDLIREEVGDEVTLVDPAKSCADKVREVLIQYNLQTPQDTKPQYRYYVSDDSDKFCSLGSVFLGEEIDSSAIECVNVPFGR